MTHAKVQEKWSLASADLHDAYTDFMLSRQATQCTKATLEWYSFTAGRFVQWVAGQGVASPQDITARHVRQYLTNLEGKSSNTIHGNARAIRTLLIFMHSEGYISQPVKFDMPKLIQKRLSCLTAEQVKTLLKVSNVRDRALLALAFDTGLRREEIVSLNWNDLDFQTGLIRVTKTNGGKFRSVCAGAKTRRLLLAYRRKVINLESAMFQTSTGERLRGDAFRHICKRLAKRTDIAFSPHTCRRTAATLLLKSGVDLETLRRILGHSDLSLLNTYVTLLDADIVTTAKIHSPIDSLD
jgi:integrase/recombinase XerD